jgi:hypothetical protein
VLHAWIDPLTLVEKENHCFACLKLHLDIFSVHAIRLWVSHESHVFKEHYAAVLPLRIRQHHALGVGRWLLCWH